MAKQKQIRKPRRRKFKEVAVPGQVKGGSIRSGQSEEREDSLANSARGQKGLRLVVPSSGQKGGQGKRREKVSESDARAGEGEASPLEGAAAGDPLEARFTLLMAIGVLRLERKRRLWLGEA